MNKPVVYLFTAQLVELFKLLLISYTHEDATMNSQISPCTSVIGVFMCYYRFITVYPASLTSHGQ